MAQGGVARQFLDGRQGGQAGGRASGQASKWAARQGAGRLGSGRLGWRARSKRLGKALGKTIRVAAVGIKSLDGAYDIYRGVEARLREMGVDTFG